MQSSLWKSCIYEDEEFADKSVSKFKMPAMNFEVSIWKHAE